jgi:hypothetical protein
MCEGNLPLRLFPFVKFILVTKEFVTSQATPYQEFMQGSPLSQPVLSCQCAPSVESYKASSAAISGCDVWATTKIDQHTKCRSCVQCILWMRGLRRMSPFGKKDLFYPNEMFCSSITLLLIINK